MRAVCGAEGFGTVEARFPFLEDGTESWISWAFQATPMPRIFKVRPLPSGEPRTRCAVLTPRGG